MIRIMILDDDEMYLKKEKDITEQYFAEKNVDCTVTTYQNVEWFLLGLNEEKFDMYILDIRMPGENGIEAAREIRRSERKRDQTSELLQFPLGLRSPLY